MSGDEQAERMLDMALKDLKSLGNMLNPEEHDEEIFGFHAQQAIEKVLKAWIAHKGLRYQLTHDLGALLHQLEDNDEDVTEYWSLVEYTTYGVLYRYESMDLSEEPLERKQVLEEVGALVHNVRQRLVR